METYEGSELYKMNRAYVAVFDRVIRDGVLRGDVNDRYSRWLLRDLFFGGLEHAMRTILIKRREDQVSRFVEELVGLMMNAMQPAAAGEANIKNRDLTSIAERVEAAAERLEQLAKIGPV